MSGNAGHLAFGVDTRFPDPDPLIFHVLNRVSPWELYTSWLKVQIVRRECPEANIPRYLGDGQPLAPKMKCCIYQGGVRQRLRQGGAYSVVVARRLPGGCLSIGPFSSHSGIIGFVCVTQQLRSLDRCAGQGWPAKFRNATRTTHLSRIICSSNYWRNNCVS